MIAGENSEAIAGTLSVTFNGAGVPVPGTLPQLEMRARPASLPGREVLVVSVRLKSPVNFDLGFAVRIEYADAAVSESFISFGNGVLPADRAAAGDVYTFFVAPAGRVKSCRIDPVVIGDSGQEL